MLDIALRRLQGQFQVDVAFQSPPGAVTALFGRSGSGKTSVISMVAGLSQPDEGHIRLDRHVLFDSARHVNLPPHRRRVGYVFQESRLFPHYSVRGNLRYGMERVPSAERFVKFDDVVDLLGIGALLDRRPHRLSGGERQRVAIGRALLTSPHLLLMDEPLASLDGARKAELLPFIALLPHQFQVPILYVSHSVNEVLRLADRMVLMDDGRATACGAVEEVMSLPAFAKVAGGTELSTVMAATVVSHDDALSVTRLSFAGGTMTVPRLEDPVGERVRVRVEADNVILALNEPSGLSVRNSFGGTVTEVESTPPVIEVTLDIGCQLRARITAQALAELGLRPGMPVHALVKGVSIARGDIAAHEGLSPEGGNR